MENYLVEYLGARKTRIMNFIFKEDLELLVKTKLAIQPLNSEEINLLNYLIWQYFSFREFTNRSLVKWIMDFRNKRIKELIKIYDKQSTKTARVEEVEPPKIFMDVVHLCKRFGVSFLSNSMTPFDIGGRRMEIENLGILLKSLELSCGDIELAELKYYCASRGLLCLKDTKKQNQKVELDVSKMLIEIENQLQELYNI